MISVGGISPLETKKLSQENDHLKRLLVENIFSILCEEEIYERPKTNSAIGIDLGISDFAIFRMVEKSITINLRSEWKRS
ncbi:hypothetical protein P7H15_19355 [Paenibacillus larvae]|nr:hypothetical protein [Paenibacillus larvae]